MAVNVGTFAKTTSGAPAAQSVTGVGFQPRALILWTVGATANETYAAHIRSAMGISDGSTSGAIASSLDDATANTNAARNTATAVLSIINGDGTVLAEANLTSFDADGFTLNWTTNDANATIINYMAITGASITNIKAVSWQMSTSTGDQAVTGVGFQPDAIISICASQAAQDTPAAVAIFGFMFSQGTTEAGLGWSCNDNQASGIAYTRNITTSWTDPLASADYVGTVKSMDADGFTMNWSAAASGAFYVYTLCLKGGSYAVGQVNKSTSAAPTTQTVSGLGFTPEGVLLVMGHILTGQYGLCEVIGASDGTNECCGLMTDEYAAATIEAKNYNSNTKVLVQDYSYAGGTTPNQVTDSAADFGGFASGEFDLDWTTNDANACKITYLALAGGAAPAAGQPMALRSQVKYMGQPWRPQRGL